MEQNKINNSKTVLAIVFVIGLVLGLVGGSYMNQAVPGLGDAKLQAQLEKAKKFF